MVKLGDPLPNASLEIAKELSKQGLQVFPAKPKDKSPIVDWKKYIGQSASHMVDKWFKNRRDLNFWVMTGQQSGYVVLDTDSPEGEAWWRERIGAAMDATSQVETSKGTHFWFKLDQPLASWGVHPKKGQAFLESWDVRADKTGVIVPPSIHETGKQYTWRRTLEHAVPAPAALLDESLRKEAAATFGTGADDTVAGTGGQTRSLLTKLLSQPPGAEGSGRNDWMTKVAGHYAKTYHNQHDLFLAHCAQANASMQQPLDEGEFTKTIESVWTGEHERNKYRDMAADTGFLASGGTIIVCQVIVKTGDQRSYELVEYADFDLQAKGVMTDESGARTYWCEVIRRKRGGSGDTERFDIVLRAEVLGDDRALRKFLARFACTIVPPDNMWPKAGTSGVRIQRYLESQQPPIVRITPHLGYDSAAVAGGHGGFITHDGAITHSGLRDFGELDVRADPRLRASGTAAFEYGFDDNEVVAAQVLEEVMSFHHDEVTSVYGAWWAACLLKPQIQQRTSLFPFMAVEAPSESGKTNGFFSMMLQLNGGTRGETQPTKAALRDMAASNRNGVVWVDDLDDPAYLMELLRAATSGGSLTKMGEDRESVKNTQIVAPIVISGEALGLGTQKALIDRAIILKATSPTSRRSLRDDTRPQWDDVLDLRERYPDGLHTLAGWYVQSALGVEREVLAALQEARRGGSGRAADKVAVLRAGSRLLDYLVGQEEPWAGRGLHSARLELWLRKHLIDDDGVAVTSDENALTIEVLPWAIQKWNYPDKATAPDRPGDMDTPVFLRKFETSGTTMLFGDDTEIWFRPDLLAMAWAQDQHGRQEKRTTTAAALRDQAEAINCRSRQCKITNSGGRRASYRLLTGEIASSVIRRSMGE